VGRCAWCCRWWRWTWAHSFARPHAAGPHHSPWTHHGARARHSARSHMVRGSAEVAAVTLRRPAQHEAGEEDHRDNENDACDDAYPRQGLAEPTGPLIVTGLFSAGCRFSAGLWCLGHVRHDAACKTPCGRDYRPYSRAAGAAPPALEFGPCYPHPLVSRAFGQPVRIADDVRRLRRAKRPWSRYRAGRNVSGM
jgi:hypothetical protein